MKVITPKEMINIETQACLEGAQESEFMEEAGSGIALHIQEFIEQRGLNKQVALLTGKGNNGADAFVAGVHLLHLDFTVTAYHTYPIEKCSKLCQESYSRFLAEGGKVVFYQPGLTIAFPEFGVIIDGIFGTGFKGAAKEPISSLIELANASSIPILSIDLPSGLNGETGDIDGPCIMAEETLFLGLPKSGFFLKKGWNTVGKLRFVDFGLPKNYLEMAKFTFMMLTAEELKTDLPKLVKNRHKYQAGHVVGLAGSPSFQGAGILSGYAALKGGAGIVHVLYPKETPPPSQFPYELIFTPYETDEDLLEKLNQANAVFIGPGLGSGSIYPRLQKILPLIKSPCVLDADALNALAEHFTPPPKKAILTPHLGELKKLLRLSKPPVIDKNFLSLVQNFVDQFEVTVVMKGGPTFIFHPKEPLRVCPKGNPGMATAGSGDLLTGLIAALLAQGLSPLKAASLGVYIHGIAGDFAALEYTAYSMIATDILNYFPEGFRLLEF